MSRIGLSVLICTYNRPDLLRGALRSVVVSSDEKPDEVLVVNSGDERTDAVVREFQDYSDVEVRLVKTVNKNREQPRAGAVGGLVVGSNVDSLVGKVADAITFPAWESGRTVRTLPGVNISYKRGVLEHIGLQDETLFRGEDVDFNWRVQQSGYTVYFDPSIKVYHHHRPTLKGFLNQHYMYGRAYYLVRRKWPEMYCVYPHRVRRFKDVLKAGHFVLAPCYEPFLSARRVPAWWDRLFALPLLFFAGLVWRGGMLEEAFRQRRPNVRAVVGRA
jgi:GT2 family glycosyltransferase